MSDSEDDCNEKRLNIVVLGDQNVGKTNLIRQFCHNDFSRVYVPTIGADFYIKRITLSRSKDVIVRITDVSGMEMNGHMVDTYLFKTNMILLVYDITNMESFKLLTEWLRKICEIMKLYTEEETPKIAVMGNKSRYMRLHFQELSKGDLEYRRAMRLDVIHQFTQENMLTHFSVSAKTGEKVNSSFMELIAGLFNLTLSDLERDKQTFVIEAELIPKTPQSIEHQSKMAINKKKLNALTKSVNKSNLSRYQSCTIQ